MQDLLLSAVEHRICDHYLPKLRAVFDCADAGMLWDESDPNAVGAIVLHVAAHLRGVTRMLDGPGVGPCQIAAFRVCGFVYCTMCPEMSGSHHPQRRSLPTCQVGAALRAS